MSTTSNVHSVKEAAQALHGFGFNVIPCGKAVRGTWSFKASTEDWNQWQEDRQSVGAFEAQPWDKATGLAIVHGVGNVRAFDFDAIKDKDTKQVVRPVPFDTVEAFCNELGLDPASYEWIVQTGNGWHVWVLADSFNKQVLTGEDKDVARIEFPPNGAFTDSFGQFELRWKNHITLVPPSRHSEGKWYRFKHCSVPSSPPAMVQTEAIVRAVNKLCQVEQVQRHSGSRLPESKRTTVGAWTTDKVRNVLAFIPKQQDHIEWKKTVAAVVDAIGAEQAVPLLQEWSPIPTGEPQYGDIIKTGLDRVTAGTLVHQAKQNGWTGDGDKGTLADQVQGYLLEHFELQYNELRRQLEYRLRGGDVWHVATDRTFEQWTVTFEKVHGKRVAVDKVRLYAQDQDVCRSFDPIKDFFDGLPAWDGSDHIERLAASVELEDEERRSTFLVHLKKWFVGTYSCGYFGGAGGNKNELFLILQGGQGVGKTTLLRKLVPKELERYRCEHYNASKKEDTYSILSKSFVCIDEELSSMTKKDTEDLKLLLSMESFEFRSAYGRTEQNHPRRVSFCGSTNESTFLRDTTGSRRFLVHAITNVDRGTLGKVDFVQVWAQAVALYDQGFEHYLLPDEVKELQRQNAGFEVADHLEDTLLRFLRPPIGNERGEWWNPTEILERVVQWHDEANTVQGANSYNAPVFSVKNAVTRLRVDKFNIDRVANLLVKHGFEKKAVKRAGMVKRAFHVVKTDADKAVTPPTNEPGNEHENVPF